VAPEGAGRRDPGPHAIRLDPKLAEAYLLRAMRRGNKGAHALAVQDLDEALRLAPDCALALHLRGDVHPLEGHPILTAASFEEALGLGTLSPAQADAARRGPEAARQP
jgi:Tfp pilus assembly protein PilF